MENNTTWGKRSLSLSRGVSPKKKKRIFTPRIISRLGGERRHQDVANECTRVEHTELIVTLMYEKDEHLVIPAVLVTYGTDCIRVSGVVSGEENRNLPENT